MTASGSSYGALSTMSPMPPVCSPGTPVYTAWVNTERDMLHLPRGTGADEIITRHVRAGLPYTGPSIEPVVLLDDPGTHLSSEHLTSMLDAHEPSHR